MFHQTLCPTFHVFSCCYSQQPFLQKMQLSVVTACNFPIFPSRSGNVNASRSSLMGRRELCFDGISSVCCSDNSSSRGNVVCPCPAPVPNLQAVEKENSFNDFDGLIGKIFPFTKRRTLFASLFFYAVCSAPSNAAFALGDPPVTVEQVKPPVFPSGSLFPDEDRIVQLFEGNTYSVVNIFDVTLRPQLNIRGAVEVPEGNGSGFVWDAQGHIVTNYHVIGSSLSKTPSRGQVVARVSILTPEGLQKNFEGRLVGADRAKDLAVLKVEASGDLLRPIKVGPSSSLRVGQQCLAIGNPFGFDHTLTVGVISGLNRDIFSQAGVTIAGGIQTDAAINPGNSGGPLLDSKGNLIGINTAIFTRTGASAGVGFAIPSSTVFRIVPQLIQYGKTVRAGLNIEVAPDVVANQLNVQNGALILQVPQNSLAAKAGLLPTSRGISGNIVLGDIIVAVDRKPVKNKSGLNKILDEYNVGDKILLQVRRGSENLELPVVLEEMA